MNEKKSRYRMEMGHWCIDVGAKGAEQLFDNRDPAPFRERDLDPQLVHYLSDAVEDLSAETDLHVIFWLAEPCPPDKVDVAYRAFFDHALDRLARQGRQRRRQGGLIFAMAIAALVVLMSGAQLVRPLLTGPIGSALVESVVILSWIILWRPAEVLLYDWIPQHHEGARIKRLLEAKVEVRAGTPPQV